MDAPQSKRTSGGAARRTAAWVAAAGALAGALGGCASRPVVEGPPFPDGLEQTRVLDVHVLRDGTQMKLTNTSSRSFGPVRVWVNRWYGLDVASLKVGETLTLELGDFTDRFGQPFRAGGFFASETADPLVQVQVQEGGELIGLIVVGDLR